MGRRAYPADRDLFAAQIGRRADLGLRHDRERKGIDDARDKIQIYFFLVGRQTEGSFQGQKIQTAGENRLGQLASALKGDHFHVEVVFAEQSNLPVHIVM
jgi:hypothetical protein